jgi:hypothetical protein
VELGAHNREILQGELGYSDAELQSLADDGVIANPFSTDHRY